MGQKMNGDHDMREFAKSALSFTWALSLLGVHSAASLLKPEKQKPADIFEPVTEVAVNQLNESMRGVYRYGDNIQEKLVDTAFSWMNPTQWSKIVPFVRSGCSGQADNNRQQTAPDANSQQAYNNGSQSGPESNATGWGPMPAN